MILASDRVRQKGPMNIAQGSEKVRLSYRAAFNPSGRCTRRRQFGATRNATDWGTAMEKRIFGRIGSKLSVLGFGCGAVGGLMVRGDPRDQERAVARAIAAGVNYFGRCRAMCRPNKRACVNRLIPARR